MTDAESSPTVPVRRHWAVILPSRSMSAGLESENVAALPESAANRRTQDLQRQPMATSANWRVHPGAPHVE